MSPVFQQHQGLTQLEVFPHSLSQSHVGCASLECLLLGVSSLSSLGSSQLGLHSSGVKTPSLCPHSFPKALLFCKLGSDYFFGLLHSKKSASKAGWVCYGSVCGLLTEFLNAGF